MTEPTLKLRELARRITDAYLRQMPLVGAVLTGSGARGDADRFSDLDLLMYAEEVPPAEAVAAAQRELGTGTPVVLLPHGPSGFLDQFPLDGIQCQVGVIPVGDVDDELDGLLVDHEGLDSPVGKIATGLLEGIALHGEELIARWRGRVEDYPDSLRVAMVRHWWRFFPLWYHERSLASRDAGLWRQEELVNAAYALLGTLAGVNRLYFARFELKRQRAFMEKMTLAPPRLADRLESLFTLPPADAIAELGALVLETQAIVERELPGIDVSLRRPPGTSVEIWASEPSTS
jgi:predicted nucleotidyltransferase